MTLEDFVEYISSLAFPLVFSTVKSAEQPHKDLPKSVHFLGVPFPISEAKQPNMTWWKQRNSVVAVEVQDTWEESAARINRAAVDLPLKVNVWTSPSLLRPGARAGETMCTKLTLDRTWKWMSTVLNYCVMLYSKSSLVWSFKAFYCWVGIQLGVDVFDQSSIFMQYVFQGLWSHA